jgi:RHS repeat-associated protein
MRIWPSLFLAVLFPTVVAAQSTTQVVEFYTTDALGSVRAVTKQVDGVWVATRHDVMPFGEEVAAQPWPAYRFLFTGKERDFETGQDYFGARYYRANIGRFTTVDPELNIEGSLINPQKWNRYAYVLNNPLRYIDKDGREEDAAYSLYLIREQVRKMGGDAAVAQMDRRNAIMGLSIAGGLAAGALAAEAAPATIAMGLRLLNWLGDKLGSSTEAAVAGPIRSFTEAQLNAAKAGTDFVTVFTKQTAAPQAGRGLSVAAGDAALAVANAARSGSTVFSGQVPTALMGLLQKAGLVTQNPVIMNGVKGVEYRFRPEATKFIVDYLQKQ